MAKIKICGLSRPVDITMVNEALPDYIGFVFAKSKRQVNEAIAEELKAMLNPKILAVGVFVNEEINQIVRLCNRNIIDIVQLHGDENEAYINELKSLIPNTIIKAVRVRDNSDIVEAEKLNSDYLLLDAYKEGSYGGSGDCFDWTMIAKLNKPYFLAGGINSGNVIEAITKLNPYAVDVSSGVETDGVKDKNKIMDIITKVRSVTK
jgi:phosphoribosylanthranilate isomerase